MYPHPLTHTPSTHTYSHTHTHTHTHPLHTRAHSQDIAVLTDNVTLCNRIYSESFNVVPRQICRENYTTPAGQARSWSQYNNEQECTANDGKERDEGGGER